jgi:hypothetical protein
MKKWPKLLETKVRGQDITNLNTLKSWFDNNSIQANLGDVLGGQVRIECSELIKILGDYYWDAEVRKPGGHIYLINPKKRR